MSLDKARTDFSRFYEEVGERYPEEEIVYRDLRGILRKRFVLGYVRRFSGAFLDLGCNTGVYLREYEGELAVGIDLSLTVLKKAREKCQRAKIGELYFIKADVENLNCITGVQFDFILCSEVLEHLLHPEKVFVHIARLLKPGGTVLVTTPNYRRTRPTWVSLGALKHVVHGEEYYHTAYRPEELAEMATQAGLHVIDRGTLEWEVKYAAKIPALKMVCIRKLNRALLKSSRIDQLNQRLFERLTLFFYKIGHYTGVEKLLRRFIKEGVRSYIVATKTAEEKK